MSNKTTENSDLERPEDLTRLGKRAHKLIMSVLKKHKLTYTGGCKSFYSPPEWAARGEAYGQRSELVLVHDGGDLELFFGPYGGSNYGGMRAVEDMRQKLEEAGLYVEPCTGWYSAVYPI